MQNIPLQSFDRKERRPRGEHRDARRQRVSRWKSRIAAVFAYHSNTSLRKRLRIGSEHSPPRRVLGPTSHRGPIVASRSASAHISTGLATWSNGSSIRSNSAGGSRRATTSSRRTTWPSSSSHQYSCGCALMSPRPSVQSAARNPYPATGASKTKEF